MTWRRSACLLGKNLGQGSRYFPPEMIMQKIFDLFWEIELLIYFHCCRRINKSVCSYVALTPIKAVGITAHLLRDGSNKD